MDLAVSNDYRNLPLTESMQGIAVGDVVSAGNKSIALDTSFSWVSIPEAVVLEIYPIDGTAKIEAPVEGTKKSYYTQIWQLRHLTPIG